ncbi:MAG: Gfo/Idh/MocA family oxidoreductase [Candidatus Latescibacterota bacterium]|nr:Gfo/Idh/MocA family oxidoreductase [Candidatus Latescibacterota bacterium]
MAARCEFRCGVIGYGGAFNMGKAHFSSMIKNRGMVVGGVCELDAERRGVAARDWPEARVYSRVGDMLRHGDMDLITVITPHNTHARLALQCLDAKVGVVVEKPMAVSSKEVKAMMALARRRRVMLSTFHNRRWDGDFMLLRDLILKEKIIGRVFRIEAGFNGYSKQSSWWRSDKQISGGAIYDWGAHFTDWILNLVPDDIDWVSGYQVKNKEWSDYSNEDHSEYTLKFRKGCVATLTMSNLAMSSRPKWRILGEKGSIEAIEGNVFHVQALANGRQMESTLQANDSNWDAYYQNVYRHLQGRAKLVITPESGARVIGVLEAANISVLRKGGMPVKPAFR